MNKKGIFFTLIAIALLSLLAVSLTFVSLSHERDSIKKRVGTLNNYVYSIEKDIPRKLYISSFRVIFILEKRIIESGSYVSNISSLFNEAFFNGTINGNITTDEQQLLSGVMYSDIQNDLSLGAHEVNLDIILSNPLLNITQTDPWNLKVQLTLGLFLNDTGGLASWNRSATFESYVPIENFEDPLYLLNTNGLISHKLKKSPYAIFANGTDVTNLINHVNSSYYYASNESPSFLNRLVGNLSNNNYGVESFVNSPELISAGLSVQDKSLVDHIYFSSSNPTTKRITGMGSWFKLDDAHVTIYNLSGVAY